MERGESIAEYCFTDSILNKRGCLKREAVSFFFLQFHIKYSSKNFLFLQFICIFMTVYQTYKIWQNQYLSHTIKVK